MKTTDTYYAFAFKGLLTEEALDKTGRTSPHNKFSMFDSDIIKRLPFDMFDDDFLTKAKQMATVYAALNAFENMVRSFISSKLLEEYKEEWWEKGITDTIRAKAKTRKEEEEKIKWHTQRGSNFMSYVEFGDLSSIMIKNWPLFEPHLQTQEWMISVLKSLERSRNVIMHSGDLSKEDIERIGTLMRDWFKQVGA